jgi:hypothetical protein
MSFFSNIGSAISNGLTSVGTNLANGLTMISATVTHPIDTVTKGISASVQEYKAASPLANTVQIIQNTAVEASAVLGAAGIGSAVAAKGLQAGVTSVLKTVGSAIVKHPVASGEALLTAGALTTNPNLPANTVTAFLNYGAEVGKVTAGDETIGQAAKNVFNEATDHPLLTTAAVGIAGAGIYEVGKSLLDNGIVDTASSLLGTSDSTSTTMPTNNVIDNPTPSGVETEAYKPTNAAKSSKKRKRATVKVASPSTKIVNNNYINIKNSQRRWG